MGPVVGIVLSPPPARFDGAPTIQTPSRAEHGPEGILFLTSAMPAMPDQPDPKNIGIFRRIIRVLRKHETENRNGGARRKASMA